MLHLLINPKGLRIIFWGLTFHSCCIAISTSQRLLICERCEEGKEGNVLFNDALNTFYLRLYGVRHMVKDHSDCKKGNPLLPHGLLFLISSMGSFICITPVMEHWLEREIAQWVHPMKDRSDDPLHHEQTLLPQRYISLRERCEMH